MAGREKMITDMHDRIKVQGDVKFKGLIIDTCENRPRLMSITRSTAYCDGFGLPVAIDTNTIQTIVVVGEKPDSIGTANV